MQKTNEDQLQKISLFSKEQLRKNLYLSQHLNPDLTIKTKIIYQQRKVATITKDNNFILECLRKCPLVKVINPQILCILVNGDALIVRVAGEVNKNIAVGELKKIVVPLLKDIKNQIREGAQDGEIQIQFQSETSVTEFVERLKAKGAPISYQLKQKDPYECIKKSIKYLLKQRKNQQESSYQSQPYDTQNYYQNYYQYQQYQTPYQTPYQQQPQYQNNKPYTSNSYSKYPTFIRKAVDSDEQQQIKQKEVIVSQKNRQMRSQNGYQNRQGKVKRQQKRQTNTYTNGHYKKNGQKDIKFDSEDFPQL